MRNGLYDECRTNPGITACLFRDFGNHMAMANGLCPGLSAGLSFSGARKDGRDLILNG